MINSNLSGSKLQLFNYDFDEDLPGKLQKSAFGQDWPVVYILNNGKEAYVGESSNVSNRMRNHLMNPERRRLSSMHVVFGNTFNKSVILDMESKLILYMKADQRFELQNANAGQSQTHNYFQRDLYQTQFIDLWKQLMDEKLAIQSISKIENSDLFKFSPFKTLTTEQFSVAQDVITYLMEKENNYPGGDPAEIASDQIFITGSAGTGKSVLAVFLAKTIADLSKTKIPDMSGVHELINQGLSLPKDFKVGLVFPMKSIRKTINNVFKDLKITSVKVLSPIDASKEKWDLLIVDEAHRLKRRKNLTGYADFDKTNKRLGLDPKSGTELDWIIKSSRYQIFFYDPEQRVMPSDLDSISIKKTQDHASNIFSLNSQLRCLGGEDYIKYLKQIFSDHPPTEKKDFMPDYEFRIYDDVQSMVDQIKNLDSIWGLCRVVAGFGWDWETRKNKLDEIKKEQLFDIEIGSCKLLWNTTNLDWVNSENAINEVGCIHTIQGYDMNYTGVIVGPEIAYDEEHDCLTIKPENYRDKKGKAATNYEDLRTAIFQTYEVLCSRGIRGTFLYAVDPKVRDYLKRFCEEP